MRGLTTVQVRALRIESGPNILPEPRRATFLTLLFRQFAHPFILILMVASVLALVLGATLDAAFILSIVVLIGFVGFLQEYKAERTILALKTLLEPVAVVIRDGVETRLPARDIVPGDVVVVQTGERIPADGTVIEAQNLEVDESPLTGESLAVEKNIDGTEEERQVFLGTTIVNGRGFFTVSSIGGETAFGKIVQSLKTIEDEQTPLEAQLKKIATQLAFLAIVIGVGITALDLLNARPLFDVVLTNMSIAVAVVPEGLPAVVTIALAIGSQRMAAKRAAVRKMNAVETLGDIDVICTDKTGTLTTGQMQVERVWLSRDEDREQLLKGMVLCNSAMVVEKVNHGTADFLGDPTEIALLRYAQAHHRLVKEERAFSRILHEFSFDQKRKMMSVVVEKKEIHVFSKGAPEIVLNRCTLSPQKRKEVERTLYAMAQDGLRVLAFASKEEHSKKKHWNRDLVEYGLTLIGLVGLSDPPREEVAASIAAAQRAGIRVVMVTGDHERTAQYIGQKIGLLHEGMEVMTGSQLDLVTEQEFPRALLRVGIFARTTPLQKLRIVRGFQSLGKLTAVTGDGVNDAPALKQADVGIAMGQTGTDVARSSADIVLTDDNFATIIGAIAEGRKIALNTRTAARFLIVCNMGEVVAIVGAALVSLLPPFYGLPTPLSAIQLLWTNFVTDGLPALALSVESQKERPLEHMHRPHQTVLSMPRLFVWGSMLGVMVLGVYVFSWLGGSGQYARTIAFTALVVTQLLVAFFVRTSHGPFWHNRLLLFTILASVAIQFAIITLPPLQRIFKTVPLW